jgi:hypothetical protein
VLLDRNSMMELLEEPRLGTPRFRERACTDDLARPIVGDAQNDRAASLVGESDAVLDQLLEVESSRRRLELDVPSLRLLE